MGKYCLLLTEREASTTVVLPDNLNMDLKQQRRRRQREWHKKKGLMSKNQ